MKLLLAFAAATLTAQTFDAASVKRLAPQSSGRGTTGVVPRQQQAGRISYPNVTLKAVLAVAYGVAPDQIEGPQWLDDERYDIAATLPADASQDQVPVMLQKLLADRFHLVARVDSKPRTAYWLVAGKTAPKLQPAKDKDGVGFETKSDSVVMRGLTIANFGKALSTMLKRPVLDHTGIEGQYEITLNMDPGEFMTAGRGDSPPSSIFAAVQDLGLKLETHSEPAAFVTVEKADRIPTDN